MPDIDEDRIRQRAYQVWERKGRPEGNPDDHWYEAVGELMGEDHLASGGVEVGSATPHHPGGTLPAGGARVAGSIGTGGGSTANDGTGSQPGRDSE